MNGVVAPQPAADGEREHGTEHAHRASGRAASASYPCQPMLARLDDGGSRAFGHAVAESFDILPRHGRDLEGAQEWFDMAFDAAPIAVEGGRPS